MSKAIEASTAIRQTNRSPVYAIADELEAMTYRKTEISPRMEDVKVRFGSMPSTYLEDPAQWPSPGVLGVWVKDREVIVRWIDPETGIKTSAHRRTCG